MVLRFVDEFTKWNVLLEVDRSIFRLEDDLRLDDSLRIQKIPNFDKYAWEKVAQELREVRSRIVKMK